MVFVGILYFFALSDFATINDVHIRLVYIYVYIYYTSNIMHTCTFGTFVPLVYQ